MSRGTLRYSGFCAGMAALTALGFLSTAPEPLPHPPTRRGWLAAAVSLPPTASDSDLLAAAASRVAAAARGSVDEYSRGLPAVLAQRARATAPSSTNVRLDSDPARDAAFRRLLAWCGLLSDAPLAAPSAAASGGPPPPAQQHVPIDTLVSLLTAMPEMSFAPGERDMVVMQHVVEVRQ